MTAEFAVEWCRRLTALAVLLQTIELGLVWRGLSRGALFPLAPLRNRALLWLFGPAFGIFLALQGALAALVLLTAHGPTVAILLLTTLLQTARFAGNFNGGSDRMTLVVLTGLTVELTSAWWPKARLVGLGWIAAQLTLSYFIAGVAKLREPAWRDGTALGAILNSGHYRVPARVSALPAYVVRTLGFVTLAFELGFPLVFVVPRGAPAFLLVALCFHLGNFVVLGLNRFVWAWVAAWPALLYVTV